MIQRPGTDEFEIRRANHTGAWDAPAPRLPTGTTSTSKRVPVDLLLSPHHDDDDHDDDTRNKMKPKQAKISWEEEHVIDQQETVGEQTEVTGTRRRDC